MFVVSIRALVKGRRGDLFGLGCDVGVSIRALVKGRLREKRGTAYAYRRFDPRPRERATRGDCGPSDVINVSIRALVKGRPRL